MSADILVTEDESIVRKDIVRSLEKLGYNVVGTADTGEKAVELAKSLKPDLCLMDIMLKGDMTGIEAAEKIKESLDVPVIYLTAYADESTLAKAKISEPHGYILKPFKEIDLQTSIEIAIHKHKSEADLKVENDLLKSLYAHKDSADYLFVKSKSRLVRLDTSEIYFVEALKDYVVINLKDMRYTIHSTMKDIERKLPATVFQRVHRSYIINMDKIEAIYQANVIISELKKEIPIGGSYRDALSSRINVL
jgi:DNA-binding LytR/AlgR family response regulator